MNYYFDSLVYALAARLKMSVAPGSKNTFKKLRKVFSDDLPQVLLGIGHNTRYAISRKIAETRSPNYQPPKSGVRMIDAIEVYGPFVEPDTINVQVGRTEDMDKLTPWWRIQNYGWGPKSDDPLALPEEISGIRYKKDKNGNIVPVTVAYKSAGMEGRHFIEAGHEYLINEGFKDFEAKLQEKINNALR